MKSNKLILVKSVIRALGLFIILISSAYAIYMTVFSLDIAGDSKKGSFLDISVFLLDLYVWVISFVAMLFGMFLWSLGIVNNPKISLYEKNLNKYIFFFFILIACLIIFLMIF